MSEKIVVMPTQLQDRDDWGFVKTLRGAGHEVSFTKKDLELEPEIVIPFVKDADAVIAGSEPYTPEVIEACGNLQAISRTGVGYDAVNVEAATRKGILVTTTPGQNHEAVADMTMTHILSLARDLLGFHRIMSTGRWVRHLVQSPRDSVLGVVGLGRIGKAVVKRAKTFGFNILGYEKLDVGEFAREHGVELVSLEELLQRSDFVTLHVPLSDDTWYMINEDRLALMKNTACIVNTARGPLIKEAALVEALRSGQIAGAGLDVFEAEPPEGSPLLSMENVTCSPHIAGLDLEATQGMAQMAAETILDVFAGRMPKEGVINPEAWGQ